MNRRDKVKKWFKDHQDVLVITGVINAVVGGFIALVTAEAKAQEKETAHKNAMIDDLNAFAKENDMLQSLFELTEMEHMEGSPDKEYDANMRYISDLRDELNEKRDKAHALGSVTFYEGVPIVQMTNDSGEKVMADVQRLLEK